jgi:ubiquinone biosynthesis protein Coq4
MPLIFFKNVTLGLAVMVIMLPLNAVVSNAQKILMFAQMRDKDRRSRLMDEILNGMKVLKLYAWEESFEKAVAEIRDEIHKSSIAVPFA